MSIHIHPYPSISKFSEYLTIDIQHLFFASHLEAFCSTPPTKTEAVGKAQFESAATSDLMDPSERGSTQKPWIGGMGFMMLPSNCFWMFMELAPASAKSDAMEIASRA